MRKISKTRSPKQKNWLPWAVSVTPLGLYTDQDNQPARVAYFGQMMKTARILINTPASQGGIGDLYNFKLAPSLTLGCGSWGGNSISETLVRNT
ncbi:alcohol dehydrogenase [Klebsiella variicola]|uniref:Alcohol dehydrogenase n=1 Tax=Klebsiella variicola TaxID=244366 RepID=A0A7H4MME1_KLEVA|nr:alcohol dehydrogenase [Klebsiella variicola]